MLFAEQASAPAREQMAEAGSKPSATTVLSMLAAVTHTGVSSTEGTLALAVVSCVVPLTRAAGGVWPARSYRAAAAAASASR